uniref:Uncharacterized protein n=1 Tax=Cyclophora tenuis TaxID=216820 RepID=A0A7S1CUY8_CYCTE|mmetsp:Transcript_10430/g.17546  ORF Transcript_10430/g.17546 Transcript_10430/m.17546 type:complete len:156 (+) Transcript_10430:317-784(+)
MRSNNNNTNIIINDSNGNKNRNSSDNSKITNISAAMSDVPGSPTSQAEFSPETAKMPRKLSDSRKSPSFKLKKGRVLHAIWKQILVDTGRVWKSERWGKMTNKKDPTELRSKSQTDLIEDQQLQQNLHHQDQDHHDDETRGDEEEGSPKALRDSC